MDNRLVRGYKCHGCFLRVTMKMNYRVLPISNKNTLFQKMNTLRLIIIKIRSALLFNTRS